ncbi:hypothetical protein ABIA32_004050 [Streptacidiphilus sp. MAP12-20]|uniref:hypothetical protein n=1 Tax=Streptacidiphilus sp. MAP12-20 TaxID=3156299 RepID=UPI0035187445
MRSHARFAATAAAVAAAGFVLVAGGSAVADTTSPSSSSSSGSMTPTTVKYYGVSTSNNLYTADGRVVTNPNTAPAVGDYFVATDNDYTGTQASHGSDVVATDHVFCLFTKAPAAATCSAEIATGTGMIYTDNSQQNFASGAQSQTYKITGGTGAYQGAKGTVVVTPVSATSNNSDFVVTWSK